MSQISAIASSQVGSVSGSVIRWSDEHTLFFLALLLEARRAGLMNSSKKQYLREGLQTLLPRLIQRFPGRSWVFRSVENKYQYLKKFWRVFAAAEKISGTTYDPRTGKLSMSKQNEDLVIQRHSPLGRRVIVNGLLVGNGINLDEWREIFSNELPAGLNIVEASDEAAFAADSQNDDLGGTVIHGPSDGEEEGSTQPVAGNEAAGDPTASPDSSDDDDLDQPIMSPPPSTMPPSTVPRSTLPSSMPPPSALPPLSSTPRPSTPPAASAILSRMPSSTPSAAFRANSVAARKRKKAAQNNEMADSFRELASAMVARDSSQQMDHHVTHNQRAVGAEDFEKAIRDCFLFAEERGMLFVTRLVHWIREDPLNPLIWNAMPSKEAKDAWLAINFP